MYSKLPFLFLTHLEDDAMDLMNGLQEQITTVIKKKCERLESEVQTLRQSPSFAALLKEFKESYGVELQLQLVEVREKDAQRPTTTPAPEVTAPAQKQTKKRRDGRRRKSRGTNMSYSEFVSQHLIPALQEVGAKKQLFTSTDAAAVLKEKGVAGYGDNWISLALMPGRLAGITKMGMIPSPHGRGRPMNTYTVDGTVALARQQRKDKKRRGRKKKTTTAQ